MQKAPPHTAATTSSLTGAALLGLLVFGLALLGIWARPLGFMSVLWPANSLLLGALLLRPHLLNFTSAIAVFMGYAAADLLAGSRIDVALLLAAANMLGVMTGWLVMHKNAGQAHFMKHQSSAFLIFIGSGCAALASTFIATPVLTTLFKTPLLQAFSMWFSGEWINYMICLPPLLALSTRKLLHPSSGTSKRLKILPLVLVVISEIGSYWLGGPGALAFSLPALLWCAVSYRILTLTVITTLLCISKIVAFSTLSFDFTPAHFLESVSIRIGLIMLILGPLSVASANAARNELLHRLRHAVNHDYLTHMLSRGAFIRQGQRTLDRAAHEHASVTVLMLDLDHFKSVNDRYGHAGGDLLLRGFSNSLSQALRPQDLVGRMGGEEFAVLLTQLDPAQAQDIAQRINQLTRELRIASGGDTISATVSIGMVFMPEVVPGTRLESLLQHADRNLYQAKHTGRDHHVFCQLQADQSKAQAI